MHCKIEEKNIQEIQPHNIVQQTSFWAMVKNNQGMDPMAFDYAASFDLLNPLADQKRLKKGDLLVLLQKIDKDHSVAYIPYGPIDEPVAENHGPFLEELSETLRPQLPQNTILIRYDLPWENQWAQEEDYFDNDGQWTGPPDPSKQEFRINFNTNKWNLLKAPEDNLPTNTIFLDLNNHSEQLIAQMKPKTRYNIRLAYRRGIKIHNYGLEHIDDWYHLYEETALRNGVTLHKKDFFKSVLLGRTENPSKFIDVKMLMATYNQEPLAAMFLIISNKRSTYLYGASAGKKRNLMPTYALQWEAMKIAKASGCTEYDMFGAAPNADSSHPMYGLYKFKTGFGGHLFHRMGCWDYPLNEKKYQLFIATEMSQQGYYA